MSDPFDNFEERDERREDQAVETGDLSTYPDEAWIGWPEPELPANNEGR
ncbi:MAG TPA: hypothetical protein VH541_05770 [Gaiellaceae bacterium]|jgi:hypothetical protein